MKLKRKIILIIAALILGVLVWFFVIPEYGSYGSSAVCGKCLQHASVRLKELFNFTIYKSVHLEKNPEKLLRSTRKEPNIPRVSPELYVEIFNKQCRHDFIEGGFGGIRGFRVFVDGASLRMQLYRVRLEMIEALYAAYVNTGSKYLARKTYELIDTGFPINDDKIQEALMLIKMIDSSQFTLDYVIKTFHPDITKIVLSMLEFEKIIPRLRQVKTEEQWRELLYDLNENIQKAANE